MSETFVEKAARDFLRPGEKTDVFTLPVEECGVRYRYVNFNKGKNIQGCLIVRNDGEVPKFDEIVEILWRAITTNTAAHFVHTDAQRWAHAPQGPLENHIRLMDDLYDGPVQRLTPELKVSFQEIRRIPAVVLEEQKKLVVAVEEAKQYYWAQSVVTKEMGRQMDTHLNRILDCKYKQLEIQVTTTDTRKKLLAGLKQVVSPLQFRDWLLVRKFSSFHRTITPSAEDLEAFEDIRKDPHREEAGKIEFEKIKANTRNPR